jgi:hypothetical protein
LHRRGGLQAAIHPLQASPEVAEKAFAFLASLGFTLQERWLTGGESFRDGWRLTFSGPIQVVVQYMDVQFEVRFVRCGLAISYLEMDRSFFGRRSGFHGNMFPPQKLEVAVKRVAEDIRENYERTLSGDDGEWNKMTCLKAEPWN